MGEPPNVFVASFAISGVGKLRKVRYGNDAKLADFLEGVHLGIAEKIGAIPDVIGARRIAVFVAGGMLFANLGGIAAANRLLARTCRRLGRREDSAGADGPRGAWTVSRVSPASCGSWEKASRDTN